MSAVAENNPLTSMSLEELWVLFPISLVAPREGWMRQYDEMEERLLRILHDIEGLRISYIGSTAIEGIWSKDIVDILIEVDADEDLETVSEELERQGFICMKSEPGRISLNYGYTPQGFVEKVYHVHLRYRGDDDELYFRDYLNDHPDIAQEYQELKLTLWKQYKHDRDAYTEEKAVFVKKYTAEARRAYGERY